AAGGGRHLLRAPPPPGRARGAAPRGSGARARDDGALRALREDRAPGGVSLREFAPHPLTAGGHRQTLLGFWRRRSLRWDLPADDLVVEGGEDVRILARVTWHPDRPRAARPLLVVVHGL